MRTLPLALVSSCLLSAFGAHASESQEIDALKARVAALESSAQSDSWVNSLSINGFANIVVGQSDNDSGYLGYDEEVDFENESLFALQFNYQVTDRIETVLQLAARGENDWDVEAEWAYASYQFDNAAKIRAGRLRLPLFMDSDYLEVGYAYPWMRPSDEVYSLFPVQSYTGIEYIKPVLVGDGELRIQANYGQTTIDENFTESMDVASIKLRDIIGASFTYELDELTLRSNYYAANLESDEAYMDGSKGEFIGLGGRWDNGNWMVSSEFTRIEVEGSVADIDSWYVAGTYRIGDFSPYIMYSTTTTKDAEERALPGDLVAHLDVERNTYSVGVRWDFTDNLAIKADVSHTTDFDGTSGYLPGNRTNVDLPVPGGSVSVPVNSGQFTDATVYSMSINLVF
ncbi:porin [Ferrimonas aestuarii]|nr:porin [Ferrimonas aestuarii]